MKYFFYLLEVAAETLAQVVSCELCKFFKNTFFLRTPPVAASVQLYRIPDFGVSTAILNPVETFRRWCKLNFGLLRGHVKSHHFTAILLKG